MKKDIPKSKTPFFVTLKGISNKQQVFFSFIGTFDIYSWMLFLKGTTSQSAHIIDMLSLNFSSSSFVTLVSLLHP